MATAKRKTKRNEKEVNVEELNPTELIAYEIVQEHGDLAPSVRRIMEAEISDTERHEALTLFRSSLGNIGDPNRDPRVAITNAS
jgi:hypothetical protein